MKNYLLVNRALAAEKNINYFNNLFSRVKEHSSPTVNRRSTDGQSQRQYSIGLMKYAAIIAPAIRYVAMVVLLLCVGVGNVLGATTLFSADFSDAKWSGITNICNSKNASDETYNGITFHSYNSSALPFVVDQSNGKMTWCNNNMGNTYWIAIPVTGVNGNITITIGNGATETRFKYATKAETSVSGSPGSGTDIGSAAAPATITITGLSGSNHVVYLGRQGSSYTTIKTITITTPDNSDISTSTFYSLYASSSKTAAQLITAADFPSYFNINNVTNVKNSNTCSSSVTTPHDFSSIASATTYYRLNPKNGTIMLEAVSNVKSIRLYGNGDGGGRTVTVDVTKNSGSGSTFSVSSMSFASSANTVVEYSTGDLTAKSGYDADTYYTYKITFPSNAACLWGIYVEAGATSYSGLYTYHQGIDGTPASWTITPFEHDEGSVYYVNNFTVPAAGTATHFYVGYEGYFYNNDLGYNKASHSKTRRWHGTSADANSNDHGEMFFAAPIDNGGLMVNVGQAAGAKGKIRINDDSNWNNLRCTFVPDGYKLKIGSTEYPFAVESGHEYRSGLVEFNSTTADDAVSVGLVDGSGDYVASDNSQAMRHIFLNTGGTSLWSKDGVSNFGVYDVTNGNWTSLLVLVPGESYLYEAWVPSNCTSVSFHRLKSSTPKWKEKDSDGTNTNIYNSTGDQTLQSDKSLFTITDWGTGSWSTYEKKGKFRMNDNYPDKNWYVRFYPYYVLSYDANGGSGAPEDQSVPVDGNSAARTVAVAAGSGMTAPTGYTFAGWNPDEDNADAGTIDGDYDPSDNVTLSADMTLYAVWSPKEYTITLNGNGGSGHTSSVTATYNSSSLSSSITNPARDCYTFDGWYSGEGGTGTLIIDDNGDLQASTTYTDGSGNWTNDGAVTLYARWSKTPTLLTVSLSGDAATPTGGSPIGTSYTLTCSATTGSISSYQWKQNTTGTKEGAVNAIGTGTTSANFNPVPAAAGTYYYYCVATDACGNEEETELSGCFTFTEPTYDVVYYANLDGASGSTTGLSDQSNGYIFNVAANGFNKSGYKFKWWNTAANGSGVDYYAGEPDTIKSADINLYAQWETVSSNEEFWVGSPFEWSTNTMTVGDMILTKSGDGVDLNGTLTKGTSSTEVNKQGGDMRHAKVIAVAKNDAYLQVHFDDGSPIGELKLGVCNKGGTKEMVVLYSTTADFSSGEYEKVAKNTSKYDQSTKAVVDFSPSTSDKYLYARIYRRLETAVYEQTGGSENTIRIYTIKAKKGATYYTGLSVAKDPSAGSESAPSISATSVEQGSGVTVTAGSAASGYVFLGWESENGTFADASSLSTTFTPTADNAVATAKYAAVKTITIKFLHNGNTEGWSVQGVTTYPADQSYSISVSGDWTVLTFSNVYAVSNINLACTGDDWDHLNTSTKVTDNGCYKWNGDAMSCDLFSVTYENGGATGGNVPTDANTYYTSQTVTVLGNTGSLTKTGYTFAGWSDGVNTYSAGNTFSMPEDNVTLTAQWTVNTYDVTHSFTNVSRSSGGTGGTNAATYGTNYSVTVEAEDGYELPDAITVTIGGASTTHYTWNSSTGTVVVDGDYILGAVVITITGEDEACTPQTLVKTVITGYESSAFQQTTTGTKAGTPIIDLTSKNPIAADVDGDDNTENGYKMDDGKKFYVQLSGTTLQAGDIIKVGITKANDNYTDPATSTKTVLIICAYNGSAVGDSIGKITGVSAAGYYTYTVKASDLTRCEGENDTIHYVGLERNKWEQNPYMYSLEILRPCAATTYSVTVAVNDEDYGSASAEDDELEEDGTTEITATPNTGYEFTSWAVSGTGAALSSTSTNPTTLTMGTANATVTATFAAKSYTLTLDKNHSSASAAASTSSVDYDATSFTPTAPMYDGHSVDGYYTSANCTTLVATAAGALQASITVSETVWTNSSSEWKKDGAATLYTKWKCGTPAITQDGNTVNITVPTGTTVYYTMNGATPTAASSVYDSSDKPTIEANTTVKAIAMQAGCANSEVASADLTYEGACSPTTLFSMVVDGSASDYSLTKSTTVTSSDDAVSSRLTSISGGTFSAENTSTSSTKQIFDDNCLRIDSRDIYMTVTLSGGKTLQAGDSITITTATTYHPYITASSSGKENKEPTMRKSGTSDPYTYTLTIANTSAATGKNLIGLSTFYLWKNSSKAMVHSITITRPCVDATHSISYDKGEGTGTMSGHASIAHNGSQELTSNSFTAPDNYTFAGWAADVDVTIGGSTVKAGALIANGATITNITSDIALTAKWKQTITLNANTSNHGSGDNTSAVAILNGTALNSITHTTAASGYKLAGYYTAATSGTKVLNADGSFASTAVTDYISDSKWTRTGAAPTLYAQYEASGSLTWVLDINTSATVLGTNSKTSSFSQISTSNMSDAALAGSLTYEGSKKSALTGKISTPASFTEADSVYVTFQVASGYKFTPSSIKVIAQPVTTEKSVKLSLTDGSSHSLVMASDSTIGGGKTKTVVLAGDGSTYFEGTVTLKIYCYGATDKYRLGTPITIEGEVEATCTMPDYASMSYSQTEYTVGDTPSSISVEDATGDPTYQWKYNSTGDRSSGTNGVTTASMSPSTANAGTTYYWCELTNACGTVKTPSVGITVNASKSTASVTWTDLVSTPNYGGSGYTIRATIDQAGWDGTLASSMLTAPEGIKMYNIEITTDGSGKPYIEAKFDIQTSFNTTDHPSKIPFVLSLPATTNYNALSSEEDVTYNACEGAGEGASYDLKVRKITTKDGNYYYWANTDGWISMNPNSSHSSEKASSAMYEGKFDSIYNTNGQYVYIRTYRANINKVRIYADFRANDMTISGVYKSTTYFTPGSGSVVDADDYSVVYNEDEEAENMGEQAQKVVDIILDEALDVNDILAVKFSSAKIRPLGAVMTEASSGSLSTSIEWSETVDDDTNQKNVTTADASFTITAAPTGANDNTLGVVTYASNHPEFASVNTTTGQVTPIAAGTAQITATLAASGCFEKATATYTVVVTAASCDEPAGRVTVAEGKTEVCAGDPAVLTLTTADARENVQWYNDEEEITDGGDYSIAIVSGTTSTLTTSKSGIYWAKAWTSCTEAAAQRSNAITITNRSMAVGASRKVEKWYVKNGRKTPDIALWSLDEGTHLNTVTITRDDAGVSAIGLTASDFKELDGVVYLSGKEPSANETGADVNYTLTLTVEDACGSTTTLSDADKKIQLIHQKNTDKHVLAFVVNGTNKGGFTEGVSADQTTNVELYKEIAKNFDVLATNIRATDDEQKLKEYYSQFDILCITDYPNTGDKGANSKSYVDAIGSLIDIRPILTMEAWVSKLDNWKAKGIVGTPKSPTTRQYAMLLQCKDHEIFSGTDMTKVGEGEDAMYRVKMVDKTQEEYATLDDTYGESVHQKDEGYQYGKKPALQGFTYDASMSSLLPLGRIDDGSGNDLQVGVERQTKMEARLLVLGINSYAMERLEDDGVTIVINALKYLMKKDAEDISDCSNYFTGNAEGDERNWFNPDNWTNGTLPDKTQEVRILAPCNIGGGIAKVASVKIVTGGEFNHGAGTANGSLVIAKDGALIVDGKIQMAPTAPYYNEVVPTTSEKLRVEASYNIETRDHSTGALIFDNSDHQNEATVEMYTKSHWDWSSGVRKKYWSYVAVPIEEVQVPFNFWNGYTYIFDEQRGWIRRGDWSYIHPFEGVGFSAEAGGYDWFFGKLASTESLDITLTKTADVGEGDNLIGNSWTAPIQIANFESGDFVNAEATIYIFNTGSQENADAAGTVIADTENDGEATAGQWLAIPIGVPSLAGYDGLKVIPAMQAYQVKATGTGSLHLDYDRLVRGKGKGGLDSGSQLNEPIRAPKRDASDNSTATESTLRVRVSGTKTRTDVWLMQSNRFSYDFDNGWEAKYVECDNRSAQLYAVSEIGNMAFLAQPEIDGTLLGFKPAYGCTEYTISFRYRGDEKLYLNDLLTETSTLITNESTYAFSSEQEAVGNRFIISSQPYGITGGATGTDGPNVDNIDEKPMKFIYNDKMYILYHGQVYDANGKLVNRK